MKKLIMLVASFCLVLRSPAQATVVGSGANCVPFTPVNLTGQPLSVELTDDSGVAQGSYRVFSGNEGLRWIWCPTNWTLSYGNVTWLPDLSGTNPNVIVFMSNADASGVQVFVPAGGAPAVATSNWPDMSWGWFWAGFGLVLSFFSFVWPLRMAKNIGAPNPEM